MYVFSWVRGDEDVLSAVEAATGQLSWVYSLAGTLTHLVETGAGVLLVCSERDSLAAIQD
jgi:hypothetical protein